MSGSEADVGDAVALIESVAAELDDIHRGKDYSQWRAWRENGLDDQLAQLRPFNRFANIWLFTGGSGGMVSQGRFGGWVIDQLVGRRTATEILRAFDKEVARNVGHYTELSPLFGVQLDASCDLGDGVRLEPPAEDYFARLLRYMPFQSVVMPTGTAILCQSYTVTPAFVQHAEPSPPDWTAVTAPSSPNRDAVRNSVRLACLLASEGPVELPMTAVQPEPDSCFVSGPVNLSGRPYRPHPLVSCSVEAKRVAVFFEQLRQFREPDILDRAIDRLGRSRLAVTDVDRALDLGMAAEIALMHDPNPSNTEITYKIASRAAWLLGTDSAERAPIFDQMRQLYRARSAAVHSGKLSAKSAVDLYAADQLVARALAAIAARGKFPDWNQLTMGGDLNPEIAGAGDDDRAG